MSERQTPRAARPAHKCATMSEVVSTQRDALKQTIWEAKANENRRQQMLKDAPSAERIEELKARHTKERLKDQERITQLIDDIGCVESAGVRSTLNAAIAPTKLKTMHMDRFDTSQYHYSFKDIYNKFEAIDKHANRVTAEKYNEYKELKTLGLLQSKRECLGRLVAIQKHALHGKTFNSGNNSQRSSSRSTQSSDSRSETSSNASYATFNAPATCGKATAQRQKVGKNVPRLF